MLILHIKLIFFHDEILSLQKILRSLKLSHTIEKRSPYVYRYQTMVLANLAVDAIYALIDPRMRAARSES